MDGEGVNRHSQALRMYLRELFATRIVSERRKGKKHHCTLPRGENLAKNRHQMPLQAVLLEEDTQVCNENAYQ